MPEPKKRMSVTRSKNRRSKQFASVLQIAKCAKCGRLSIAHRICRACAKTA